VLLAASVTMLYVLGSQEGLGASLAKVVLMLGITLSVAGLVIAIDIATPRKKLSAVSGIFLGLVAGLVTAYALSLVVDLIGLLTAPQLPFDPPATAEGMAQLGAEEQELLERREAYLNLLEGVKVFIGLITCYVSISLVIQTKDDFRFVIPYVEFAKEVRGQKPTLIDTSVLIDGRIADIVESRVMQGSLIVPRFVLNELHAVADASDKLRRARGRRGLDVLQKLQSNEVVELVIVDRDAAGETVDQKLVSLAEPMQARVMTSDFNLAKMARVRQVEVINLNDLAKAMRPVVLPGERMSVKVVKPGESAGQGVGYLEDGTMVVVENARRLVGEEVELTVTSSLQTSAGRMIFGRHEPTQPRHTEPGGGGVGEDASSSDDSGESAAIAPSDESDDREAAEPSRRPTRRNPRRNPRR